MHRKSKSILSVSRQ